MDLGNLSAYNTIKAIHISCALLSISGFLIRVILKLQNSPYLKQRWLKITPHLIDTLLLSSAIYLVISSQLNPLQHSWLGAKVIALFLYIAMGLLVIRYGKNKTQQMSALFIALLSAFYIVAVAITKNPLLI
ncbi:MAG: SirB2 family protein [Spongiibacteraceae bacterium]|nr:SirB2 family protein [Spongiibacteraceae bacterium]